jgi:hypothetical protein
MRDYHVNFWSGERSQVIGCDIGAADDGALLEELASAGRYALDLRRRAMPAASAMLRSRPRPSELGWAVCACGPLWLFVQVSWWPG